MPVIMGATEVLDERKLRLLLKHYELRGDALNEVAEIIALESEDFPTAEVLARIEEVIDQVRVCDLLNPNDIEGSRAAVEGMEWREPIGSLRYEVPK